MIKKATEVIITKVRIPSGVFSFDVLTGGGIPKGKITIFHGNKSSGKTTMALKVMGNYLAMYKDKQALYCDLEHSLDREWMSHFIEDEDLERVLVIEPTYGEEAVDLIYKVLTSDEYNVGFLLLDSIANLLPIAEIENSAMDVTVGAHARLVNKLIRKLLMIMSSYSKNNKDLTTLFINQVRVKIGAKAFTSAYKKTGGDFQDFVAHLDVRFYFIEDIALSGIPIKRKHQFRIEKSKIPNCYAHTKGEFSIITVPYDGYEVGQSDDYNIILNYAKKFRVVNREGNKWKFKKREFRVLADILEGMKQDSSFFIELYENTMNTVIEKILPPDVKGE